MNYNPIETIENDVLVVSVQGADGSYFMWQKGLTEKIGSDNGIYFEFNDQINGRYNHVKECTVTNDGIHVVLANDNLVHFCFPPDFNQLQEFQIGLNKIYTEQAGIVKFSI